MQHVEKIKAQHTGFSLVELMVGLVIGLLATLVIMQTFSAFEGQKRSTSGTADAQTNGTIALMHIQRSLETAGYGMPMPNANFESNVLRCNGADNLFPVKIKDAQSVNGSDEITIRYSTASAGSVPIGIQNPSNATTVPGMLVENNIGCASDLEMDNATYKSRYKDPAVPDDNKMPNRVTIIRSGLCEVAEIASQPTNNAGSSYIRLAAMPAMGLSDEDKLSCIGNYGDYVFSVNDATNELLLNNDPIVSGVVSMQAQYGVSADAGSNKVTEWVDAKAVGGANWGAPPIALRNRIKAVRVGLVLRNGLKEKTAVTTADPTVWIDSGKSTLSIDVSALSDWQNYRYKTFGTTVPLRNMLWSRKAVE